MSLRRAAAVLVAMSACGNTQTAPAPAPSSAPAASAPPSPPTASAPSSAPAADAAPPPSARVFTAKPLPFPGVTPPAFMDYLACERSASRVWAPIAVGSSGVVAVLDVAGGTYKRVEGFKTEAREANGKKRVLGPSAVTIGDGFAYVGDRATSEICAVALDSLTPGRCVKLSASTDGVAYVATVKEIWVTSPRESSLTILDATKPDAPKVKATIKLDGAPEGYAVDEARGLFFTNLEDKNGTLAIDVKTHKVTSTWKPGCGADGPRGLVVDSTRKMVVVACTDHLQVLDSGGALLGKLDTGAGVDNIDYLDGRQLVYVGAAKAAKLTVARLDDKGQLAVVASAETSPGARNAVVDASGASYLADAANGRLLAFPPP
jgi:hypothetical protein